MWTLVWASCQWSSMLKDSHQAVGRINAYPANFWRSLWTSMWHLGSNYQAERDWQNVVWTMICACIEEIFQPQARRKICTLVASRNWPPDMFSLAMPQCTVPGVEFFEVSIADAAGLVQWLCERLEWCRWGKKSGIDDVMGTVVRLVQCQKWSRNETKITKASFHTVCRLVQHCAGVLETESILLNHVEPAFELNRWALRIDIVLTCLDIFWACLSHSQIYTVMLHEDEGGLVVTLCTLAGWILWPGASGCASHVNRCQELIPGLAAIAKVASFIVQEKWFWQHQEWSVSIDYPYFPSSFDLPQNWKICRLRRNLSLKCPLFSVLVQMNFLWISSISCHQSHCKDRWLGSKLWKHLKLMQQASKTAQNCPGVGSNVCTKY